MDHDDVQDDAVVGADTEEETGDDAAVEDFIPEEEETN